VSFDSDVFRGRLLPDERIIWSGRPSAGIIFTTRDVFLIPFSVLWCGFAIIWTGIAVFASGAAAGAGGGAAAGGAGLGFGLFGLVFVSIGLFFTVGRFFLDAWLRQGTTYALTDKRILIAKERPSADFTAIALDRLPEARITERHDGRGTVRFGPQRGLLAFGSSGFSIWMPTLDPTPQFLAITDARRVFDLVQRSASGA
jgi:hypothetical protein